MLSIIYKVMALLFLFLLCTMAMCSYDQNALNLCAYVPVSCPNITQRFGVCGLTGTMGNYYLNFCLACKDVTIP